MGVPAVLCGVAVLVLEVAGIDERRIPFSDAHPTQCPLLYAEGHGRPTPRVFGLRSLIHLSLTPSIRCASTGRSIKKTPEDMSTSLSVPAEYGAK